MTTGRRERTGVISKRESATAAVTQTKMETACVTTGDRERTGVTPEKEPVTGAAILLVAAEEPAQVKDMERADIGKLPGGRMV